MNDKHYAKACLELLWVHELGKDPEERNCLAFVQMTIEEDLMDDVEVNEKKASIKQAHNGILNVFFAWMSHVFQYCDRVDYI